VRISETAGQLSNDLRRIAYALHPSTLDHLGLAVALRAYIREFVKRSGIQVSFTAAGVPPTVSQEIASSFYRITQEALRNIGKHAAHSSVAIRLKGTPTHLKLSIRDDGPGFDREGVRSKGGLGLISMEERARLIHAAFELKTRPGGGAAIAVSAPLA
jgi:signal transduction histidine kinase